MAHPWPGNVRQLQNALFRAAVLCEGDALTPADFPQIAAQTGPMRKEETPNAQFSDEGIGIMLYQADGNIRALADIKADVIRSEEQTSELQSIMRISYTVFFLKKKISKTN